MATRRGLNLPTKNTFIQFPVSVGELELLEEPVQRRRSRAVSLNLEPTRAEEEAVPQCNESNGASDDHVDVVSTYDACVYDVVDHAYEPREEPIALPQFTYAYDCPEQPAPQYVYTVPMFDPQQYDTPTYTGMSYSFAQEAC